MATPETYDRNKHNGRVGVTVGYPTAERLVHLAHAHGVKPGQFVTALIRAFDEDRAPEDVIGMIKSGK